MLLRDRPDALSAAAMPGRLGRDGWRSARLGPSAAQAIAVSVIIGSMIAFTALIGAAAPLAVISFVFLAHAASRLMAIAKHRPTPEPAALPKDADLPVYTVLVALCDEAPIIAQLMRALLALDYPREKLDIKFVLEAHDHATCAAIERYGLESHMSLVVAPPGTIRTKPRALNFALLFARGDLVTIFDAEDHPEPLQLRKAAAMFAHHPEVDCLQAALVPDNPCDGPVQALFTLEYAGLFDVVQNGLSNLDLPLPLGGTSNHLRRDVLDRIGGWDAYNVTEDAELGLRLWQKGSRIRTLSSVTYEEAPHTLRVWFNQRRRWSKGWLQTVIAHTAEPATTIRRVGGGRFALSAFTMAATLASMLAYPIGLACLAYRLIWGDALFSGDPVAMALDALWTGVLALGLLTAFLPPLIGLAQHRLHAFAGYLLMLPVYHLAISLATWVAVIDLYRTPFYWLKTEHGFARTSWRRTGNRPQKHMASAASAISAKTTEP